MRQQDLAIVVEEATKLIKQRFEDVILAYEKKTPEQLFIEEQVDQYDWTSLKLFFLLHNSCKKLKSRFIMYF